MGVLSILPQHGSLSAPIFMQTPGKQRVVVVEDEWVIRMQVADALMDAGWEVREFASGELALEYLGTEEQVDLLVSDIRLSGTITGWDVAQSFRGRHPDIRVIYCSGNPSNDLRRVAGSLFLPKPCDIEILLAAIRGGNSS